MKRNKATQTKKLGFALIITITMMVLLVITAVGLLSLSSIALRTSSHDSAQAEARANARMALMIAIGELQKQMGPDQRISADSAILDNAIVKHSHWTGVWNSWKAGEGESSQHSTIEGITEEMAPTYETNRYDYFRKWLVSLNDDEASSLATPLSLGLNASPMPDVDTEAILLVASGSLGTGSDKVPDYVAARLLDVKDQTSSQTTGRYAWWVGDESQKARVMDDSYATQSALSLVEQISRHQAPASTGTSTIQGLENIADDSQLAALPSLQTLDLVTNANGRPAQLNFHHSTPFSYSVLADVREGGLKRDLSTLLERPISLSEQGDEFMLYRFDKDSAGGQHRVPIQDLAAYYQLYRDNTTWENGSSPDDGSRGGVIYDPAASASSPAFKVKTPDYGDSQTRSKYLRQYTSIYRHPVPVKIQFILATGAVEIPAGQNWKLRAAGDPTHRDYRKYGPYDWRDPDNLEPGEKPDTHKLYLGVIPVLSLWNPNNVPMVLTQPNNRVFHFNVPPITFLWKKYRDTAPRDSVNGYFNLNYILSPWHETNGEANGAFPFIMRWYLQESNADIVFEPGEVKVFSLPVHNKHMLTEGGKGQISYLRKLYNPINEWDPYAFKAGRNSAVSPSTEAFGFGETGWDGRHTAIGSGDATLLLFNPEDKLSLEIGSIGDEKRGGAYDHRNGKDGQFIIENSEVLGAGFNFWIADLDHWFGQGRPRPPVDGDTQTFHYRQYQAISRFGGNQRRDVVGNNRQFTHELMQPAFPGGESPIAYQSETNAILGQDIINATSNGEARALMLFTLAAGSEVHADSVAGAGAGRKTTTRPFLHGSTITPPLIDHHDKSSLYNTGWSWQVERINNIEEAINMDPGTGNGYFGGGYTAEAGTTHVIQQHIPVVPAISIAALSDAHLGGFSLANQPMLLGASDNVIHDHFLDRTGNYRNPSSATAFSQVTATGHAGLAPHIMQAVGNSYAHPNIPSDRADATYPRKLNMDRGTLRIPFVDHSYLANKALWDEFFFSSMTPQPASVPIYGNDRSLKDVAQQFFFSDEALPNRRITAYKKDLTEENLDDLVDQSALFTDGLADKIAAHLMVEGPFNVNSTSVEAWKVFLSSLKGKPVAYLNSGAPAEQTLDGVPMNSGMIGNAPLVKTEDINHTNYPPQQWTTGRELTDYEIEELAEAIVKQVKLRGPFLSLSEFVNRRLENTSSPLALKGALQAALDDPDVSINAAFRTSLRTLDGEVESGDFVFDEAAKGPIAYGSTAYVDQADVLRHFAEQLTPRGDTFVIRAYGDSLDKNGNVEARAWCEAVVQRVPEYVNSADEPHLKQADPKLSNSSKYFGRKFQIVGFRWLNSNEI